MHDVKTFNDSSDSRLAIQKVTALAGMNYGASLELFYQAENKEAIIRVLSDAGVPIHSTGGLYLIIMDDLYQCARIKNALDTLKAANFISHAFVRQISESFPNGVGGINPLSGSATYSRIMDRLAAYSSIMKHLDNLPIDDIPDRSSDVEAICRQIGTDWSSICDTSRSLPHHSHFKVHSDLSSTAPSASSFPTDVSLELYAQPQFSI